MAKATDTTMGGTSLHGWVRLTQSIVRAESVTESMVLMARVIGVRLIVNLIYQRYRADLRRSKLDIPFSDWLAMAARLEHTFHDGAFSYQQRVKWAVRQVGQLRLPVLALKGDDRDTVMLAKLQAAINKKQPRTDGRQVYVVYVEVDYKFKIPFDHKVTLGFWLDQVPEPIEEIKTPKHETEVNGTTVLALASFPGYHQP